jgi:hypothetical protein
MTEKGQSPFYPGQPVPVELFVGRAGEVERIRRAARQVAAGKPQAIFISGESGIGKSSLAQFIQFIAERDPGLLGYAVLGAGHSVEEIALSYLRSLYEKNRGSYRGLLLVLDEINGLAAEESFAFFLKDLVDSNALSDRPLPLLLLLCGTEERRRQLIERHRPIERIFEVLHIDLMTEEESRGFFGRAFGSVQMEVTEEAKDILCQSCGGRPKLMHLLGDAAYWIAPGATVDADVAVQATWAAAEDVGRKFVDLHQRMKKLGVLAPGEERGEYAFRDRLTRLYLLMESARE